MYPGMDCRVWAQGTTMFTEGAGMPLFGEIDSLATIKTTIHPGLGWFTAELGDLDGDGYDDYAVTSSLDTTFIFHGGNPIPAEPRLYVLGGSGGVAAGDFNGDGYVDLATSIRPNTVTGNPDPDLRGYIRVYYNRKSYPPFAVTPDQIILGPLDGARWGTGGSSGWYQGIKSADFNGDGIHDLLCFCYLPDAGHEKGRYRGFLALFGGDSLSTTPSRIFPRLVRGDGKRHYFNDRYYTGDLNGDGCTDVLLLGVYFDSYPAGEHWNLDLYLGNREGVDSTPYLTMPIDPPPFWSKLDFLDMADLNSDGCDELIGVHAPNFHGSPYFSGKSVFSTLTVDDSVRNPRADVFLTARCVCPVGDMNGDGTRDVLVAWAPELFPASYVYHLYPNVTGRLGNISRGSFGIDPYIEDLWLGAFPVGDVNGDGYDDVITTGRPSDAPGDRSCKIKLYGGNGGLVGVEAPRALPADMRIRISPHPVPAGSTAQVQLTGEIRESGTLMLLDVLGRVVTTHPFAANPAGSIIPFPFGDVPPGVYTLFCRTPGASLSLRVIVL